MPITCTFSRPGKVSARGKNLAASQTLLIRRRHFLLHRQHLPSAVLCSASGHTPSTHVTSLVPRSQLSRTVRSPSARIPLSCRTSPAQPHSQALRRAATGHPTSRCYISSSRPGHAPPASAISLPRSKFHCAASAPPPRSPPHRTRPASASPQQTGSGSPGAEALTQAPPLSPRRATHRRFPASFTLRPTGHSPALPAVRWTSAVKAATLAIAPTVPSTEVPLATLPHQLSPTCSGRSRPVSPFSIWRRWLSKPGIALHCGCRYSAAAETSAIAVRPSLTATAAGDMKRPLNGHFRILVPETETEPPKQTGGGCCHLENQPPRSDAPQG